MRRLSLIALIFVGGAGMSLATRPAFGAACCAGSSAVPSLMTGDEAQIFNLGFTSSSVIGDAPASGWAVWRGEDTSEVSRTVRIDGATLLSDRFQVGASLPFVFRNYGTQSASRIGDVRVSGAYEVRTETGYADPWPKGFAYLGLVLPTGLAAQEATSTAQITGQGVWSVQLGTYWVRKRPPWDGSFLVQVAYGFERAFSGDVRYAPGWSGTAMAAFGFSPGRGDWRLGLRIQPVYQQGRTSAVGGVTSVGSYSLTWDAGADVAWMFTDNWTASVNYTDQTLFGPAVNSTLSRTVAVSLQRAFLR